MTRRPKVLLSAYACEPGKGSEAEIGWNWVQQAGRIANVWAITRASNRAAIEAELRDTPLPNVHWCYLDLPKWARTWKRGNRGFLLYYFLWQVAAYRLGRRLHATVGFDRVHHVTMGTFRLPTFLSRLPVPFIWGPVGGGEEAPRVLYSALSRRGRAMERLRDLSNALVEFDPAARSTARRAFAILATSPQSAARLRRLGASHVRVLSHTALSVSDLDALRELPVRRTPNIRFFSVGRLLEWKGFQLGLSAFAQAQKDLPGAEYWLFGDGPARGALEAFIAQQGLQNRVVFHGRVTRSQLLRALQNCDILVHPSFHDSGGYVCVEAMAAGRPVICLDLGGPGLLVSEESGIKIAPRDPVLVCEDLALAMRRLGQDPEYRERLVAGARQRAREHLRWDLKLTDLEGLYIAGVATTEAVKCVS
jgi:glycosyltransferase involved in cell wall biosynthesis